MVQNVGANAPSYQVSNVRYVAHLIDLERSFYDRLRMVQQNSGGVLQIAGQSWRSFRTTIDASLTQANNCPARVRSIKSFFFCGKKAPSLDAFGLSSSGHLNLTDFQLAIGATRYPPTANTCNAATNKTGAYTELVKAFGKVGSTVHNDLLEMGNYMNNDGADASYAIRGSRCQFCPYGIDL